MAQKKRRTQTKTEASAHVRPRSLLCRLLKTVYHICRRISSQGRTFLFRKKEKFPPGPPSKEKPLIGILILGSLIFCDFPVVGKSQRGKRERRLIIFFWSLERFTELSELKLFHIGGMYCIISLKRCIFLKNVRSLEQKGI